MSIHRFAGFPSLLTAAAVIFVLNAVPVHAQNADPLVAKINGIEIRESDLAAAEEEAGQLPQMAPEQKRDYLIAFLVDAIALAQEAENRKLGDTPQFKKRLAFARNKILMSTLLDQVGKAGVTDAEMRKVYEEAVKQMPVEEEVQARHILFRATPGDDKSAKDAEDKIKAVIVRLNKGEDFAKVASELTEDPSGKANGGDLGFFSKEQMVPEFADVAFKLEKGKISDPVKTQFGWHVIKLEEKRNKPVPAFDDVKPQLESFVVRKAQADLVTKLREAVKVERLDTPADAKPAETKK